MFACLCANVCGVLLTITMMSLRSALALSPSSNSTWTLPDNESRARDYTARCHTREGGLCMVCVCVRANLLSSPTADTRPGNHRPSSHFASTRDRTAMSHGLPLSLTAELVLAQDVLANGFSSSNWAAFLLLPLPCSTHQREAGSSQHPFTQKRQRAKLDAGRPSSRQDQCTFGARLLLFCGGGVASGGSPETGWLVSGVECRRGSSAIGVPAVGVDTPTARGGVPTSGTSVRKLVSSTNSPKVECVLTRGGSSHTWRSTTEKRGGGPH